MLFNKFYKDKKIFITGHTGFKGCWLAMILCKLGAKVTGYALAPEQHQNSLFSIVNLKANVNSNIADIRDFKNLQNALYKSQPDIIFHLAAQPLVRQSYQDPLFNYDTNVMGTVNLLEAAKKINSLKAFVNVTTDKVYENLECSRPYKEDDKLGGHDPYSASKACSEILTNSYRKSFYQDLNIGLATARAGNVIGGGDFAKDRIIPDIIQSISNKQEIMIRNPNAIRPWQYVLDVLHGYLLLGKALYLNPETYSEAYNFSPTDTTEITVQELVIQFINEIGEGSFSIDKKLANVHEAQILKLDSSKSIRSLGWHPQYNIKQTIVNTAKWYKNFLNSTNINTICDHYIEDYIKNHYETKDAVIL